MTDRALELLPLLPEYVLGALSDEERAEVEAELERSPELRAEVSAIEEGFSSLAVALSPVKPSPNVKRRLLEAIAGKERYMPFAAALSGYFDLAIEKVQALIAAIDDPQTAWEQGPLAGIQLMHFAGGPRTATADVGFVKLPAGLHFPWHRHRGSEVNFVMEGTLRDYDGTVYGPGEALVKETGTEHEFFVGTDRDAMIAVVVFEGFDILPYGRPSS